jgi:hypothetical protein
MTRWRIAWNVQPARLESSARSSGLWLAFSNSQSGWHSLNPFQILKETQVALPRPSAAWSC